MRSRRYVLVAADAPLFAWVVYADRSVELVDLLPHQPNDLSDVPRTRSRAALSIRTLRIARERAGAVFAIQKEVL